MDRPILALVADLIFESKIRGAAMAAHVPVRIVRTAEDVLDQLDDAAALVVDLNANVADASALVADARARAPHITILAYFSHVQTELKRSAVAAGADQVLPRSVFNERLVELLGELSGRDAAAPSGPPPQD